MTGIHEVQVGELENRNDDEAVAEFNAIYERWHRGELDVPLPGGETGNEVLDRYVPVLTDLRMRYLDDDDWTGDIVVVSHGAAIRLASAVLAGVDGNFALDNHLDNAESVVLAPITDGRWSCVRWGTLTPPFYPRGRRQPGRGRGALKHRPDGLTTHRGPARPIPRIRSRRRRSRRRTRAATARGCRSPARCIPTGARQWRMMVPWQ